MITELLRECRLCPRNCGVNRIAGQTGYCGAGASLKVGRASLHMWEEPCLSGEHGSGTVFFSYCNLRCVYCQNNSISRFHNGKEISVERLSEIFWELEKQGAHNINLVTAVHYLPQVTVALRQAKERGLQIPIVYNSSGYEKVEMLRLLAGLVDIYLPDFKYFSAETAARYSDAPDYPEVAKAALEEMAGQVGNPAFDAQGMMTKGVIVRHLVLPGYYEETRQILSYLRRQYGDSIYISLMNQYTPFGDLSRFSELNCRVPAEEYDRLIDYAADLGIENGFVQEGGAAEESFIPSFLGEGV